MKKKLHNPKREQIIHTTIGLIDAQGGAAGVNLREVARLSSCSAPNIYNYFESLDHLLNAALVEICSHFISTIDSKTKDAPGGEALLLSTFRSYIEYALAFPGRLNFFHFEKLNIALSTEAGASAVSAGQCIEDLLNRAVDRSIPAGKVAEICAILHLYLLGELSEYLTGRRSIEDKQAYTDHLVGICMRLFSSLKDHY